uniref:DNA-directed RNA polymerase III subunit RPC4 n=1 Tax=Rhabditophanes sp. KR3021 TaxID=114890 RepID=A0AC35UFX3_9BILA
MTGRGVQKPKAKPNLSLSGVTSTTESQADKDKKSDDKNKSGDKRNRDRRGRDGRGRGGGSRGGGPRGSNIQQTEGIFSAGVGDDLTSRSRSSRDIKVTGTEEILETTAINIEMGIEKDSSGNIRKRNVKRNKDGSSLPETYEEEWESDEEVDLDALEQLKFTSFLSDIPRMTNPPIVLPPSSKDAINGLLKDDDEDDEDDKLLESVFPDTKIPLQILNDSKYLSSVKASGYFKRLLKLSDQDFFTIQLPSTLRLIGEKAFLNENPSASDKHCLHSYTPDTEIGLLKFLKNGRVIMDIAGNRLDISAGITSGYDEKLIMIENTHEKETENTVKQELDISAMPKFFKDEDQVDNLHVISSINANVIAYHDLIHLCEKDDNEKQKYGTPTDIGLDKKVNFKFQSSLIKKIDDVLNNEIRVFDEE